jgi:hypothetical protein
VEPNKVDRRAKRQRATFEAVCYQQSMTPSQMKDVDPMRLSVMIREVAPTFMVKLTDLEAAVDAYVKSVATVGVI